MPWSVDRFTGCLKSYADDDEISGLLEGCSRILPSSPEKKAALARCLMTNFEKQFPKDVRIKVMENCGRSCISNTAVEKAKRIRKNTKNLNELVSELNKQHIGGGNMRLKGNEIYASYKKCYCGMVSGTKEKSTSTYCNCSRGWFLELIERLFERPAKVNLVK